MSQLTNDLKNSNDFKPNLKQRPFDSHSFGSLILKELHGSESAILLKPQWNDLIKVCDFNKIKKFTLLYKGSRDGFSANAFHSKCDGYANTLTIIKVVNDEATSNVSIFGRYTTVAWDSSNQMKSDKHAFLFSLVNKNEENSFKIAIDPSQAQWAIRCHGDWGPTFGAGDHDLCVYGNANRNPKSSSSLGRSYVHPKYGYARDLYDDEAVYALAGKKNFLIKEIEVYLKE